MPCGRVHLLPDGPLLLRLWGYTCPGCRPVARVKLGLARGGFVGVVVPLAAAVAVAAAAVAVLMIVLPVVLFGPCALVYEPVRRGRRLEANPPARLAGSGGMLVRACLRSAHEG